MKMLFIGSLGWTEILIIVLIVLLLFGSAKIPELMKSLGKGIRSFKDGISNAVDEADSKEEGKKE